MPLQNMSHDNVNCCIVCPVTGSSSNAPERFEGPYGGPEGQPVCEGPQFPDPVTTNTLPLVRSAAWIGLMGTLLGKVLHCPCTLT